MSGNSLQNLKTCRYLLKFSYIGTNYKGVQRLTRRFDGEDEEDGSIQTAIERAMNRALLPIYGSRLALSSRTDAGVHAYVNYANVDLTHPFGDTLYRPSFVTSSVNHILHRNAHQITLLETRIVPTYFHSRINAKSRSYVYRFAVAKHSVPESELHSLLPVSQIHRCHISNSLDFEGVQRCLTILRGEHDFVGFSTRETSHRDVRPTVKCIDRLELRKCQTLSDFEASESQFSAVEFYEIFIKSKSFLYNQVRRMVGAILDVGSGRITVQDVERILREGRSFKPKGLSTMVPPHGLFLADVEYDSEEFKLYDNFNEYSPKASYRDDSFE